MQALGALVDWLRNAGIPHVVIGGVAVGAVSRPRLTKDVDAVVMLGNLSWEAFEQEARQAGFPPRIENASSFARRSRVFLLKHSATGVDVDVSVGALGFEEETIKRARLVSFAGIEIPAATAEDLMIMKMVASRPHDIADVDVLMRANPGFDLDRVRLYTREFAAVLEAPEMIETLEALIVRHGPKKPRRRKISSRSGPRA